MNHGSASNLSAAYLTTGEQSQYKCQPCRCKGMPSSETKCYLYVASKTVLEAARKQLVGVST